LLFPCFFSKGVSAHRAASAMEHRTVGTLGIPKNLSSWYYWFGFYEPNDTRPPALHEPTECAMSQSFNYRHLYYFWVVAKEG
ncbi:hypothetical protein ABTB51_20165, partial [Acinetobacter baumannii]